MIEHDVDVFKFLRGQPLTTEILHGVFKKDGYIAGGFARQVIDRRDRRIESSRMKHILGATSKPRSVAIKDFYSTDIDVWPSNKIAKKSLDTYFHNLVDKKVLIHATKKRSHYSNSITYTNYHVNTAFEDGKEISRIQVMDQTMPSEELIESFDFTVVQAWLSDFFVAHSTKRFVTDEQNMEIRFNNIVDRNDSIENKGNMVIGRIWKYVQKGYTLTHDGLFELLSKLSPDLRTYVLESDALESTIGSDIFYSINEEQKKKMLNLIKFTKLPF
jgi:hypothetical protein